MAVAVIENGMLYIVLTIYVNNPPKLKTMLKLLLVALHVHMRLFSLL